MENRRTFLKQLLALGVAAPLTTAHSMALAGVVRRGGPQARTISARASSRQLAGQRVIYSYAGLSVPDTLLQAIRAGEAAGVIFFGENITSVAQIAAVTSQLRQAQQDSPIQAPLLLMTDQEGGLVRRLSGAPERSEKQIGQAADPVAAPQQAGAAAGENLGGVGMNVNLAPVLDVYRQPGDFTDQHQRSYSQSPQTVADCGAAFIAAQQRTGVAATAKHFPGLGPADAEENTDAGPVALNVSLPDLRNIDEAPYTAAIDVGVQLVMLSWARYPALDATYPAGLSQAIVQGELRGQLGFQGVTITDGLEAGALNGFGDPGQRAVLAARAGMDLILCSAQDAGQGQTVTAALAAALDGDPYVVCERTHEVYSVLVSGYWLTINRSGDGTPKRPVFSAPQ